jgi:hypothetical protein
MWWSIGVMEHKMMEFGTAIPHHSMTPVFHDFNGVLPVWLRPAAATK